jgi:hypothetical protein
MMLVAESTSSSPKMRERVSDVKSPVIQVPLFPLRLSKSMELYAPALRINFHGNGLGVYQGVMREKINYTNSYQSEAYW